MRALITRFTAFYGSNPLHLLATIASFALAGYVVLVMGAPALWNREVWWQSILVWFLAAVIGHDLVLFPLYALADRSLTAALAAMRGRRVASPPRVSPLNYLRVPAIGTGLSFLLFFPGIIQQGKFTYLAATGQTQQPFLGRWLLLVATLWGLSALAYAARLAVAGRGSGPTTETDIDADGNDASTVTGIKDPIPMPGTVDELALVAALHTGDEAVFAELIDQHSPSMLRVARGYVPSHEIAEEVVQETWIALLKGISKFEGRSTIRFWLFTVMINIAKARGIRERRDADAEIAAYTGGTVDPARFRPPDAPKWPGHWKEHAEPSPFPDTPEGSVLGNELVAVARRELDKLPERQRIVVTLRDILGFDSGEVCELLQISVANQRVLLHRGRAAVRQVLEDYLAEVS